VLGRFWQLRGHLHEGRRRLATMLALPGAEEPTLARAKALEAAGALALYQGELQATRALLKESLALYRQHGQQSGIAWALFHLGWMCHDHFREKAARRFLHEALVLFRLLGDRRGVAQALNALGLVAMVESDLSLAVALHEESLALSRDLNDRWAVAWALTNLGIDRVTLAKLGRGEARAANGLYEEALTIWQELGERRHLAFTHMNMADCAIHDGDFRLAAPRLELSLAMFEDLDEVNGLFMSVSMGATMMWTLGRYEEAVRLFGATYGQAKATGRRMYPLKETLTERLLDEARQHLLGAELFEITWAAGFAMPLSEAVAYMRQELALLAS
jgi:tetratricopeptide (TPR) repeat protein